jgi:hypothetical protein
MIVAANDNTGSEITTGKRKRRKSAFSNPSVGPGLFVFRLAPVDFRFWNRDYFLSKPPKGFMSYFLV